MEQSNSLAQAGELIKAGEKQQAALLLRQVLQAEPENARAWGLMAMALDDPAKRRQCFDEVMRLGDERMRAWAQEQIAQMPPTGSFAPPEAPALVSSQSPVYPGQQQSGGSAPYLIGAGVVLLITCLLAGAFFLLPGLLNPQTSAQPSQPPTSEPTATRRVNRPRGTPTITNTPQPTRTRVPRPTATVITETPIPGPTSTLTAAQAQLADGMRSLAQEKLDTALGQFGQALALDPGLTEAYVGRAKVYLRRGEWSLAQADTASALKIDPGGIEPNLLPGDLSYYQKDYEAAIKVYTQVTISHPESPIPYSRRADALYQQGKIGEAKADYGRAIGFDSTYAEASSNLAALLNNAKEYQEACTHARHAVQLDTDHPLFYARYGECLLWGARDIEGAQAAYDKAIQLNSNMDYAHIGLGDILYLQGKYSQAVTQYNLAVQLGTSRREHLLSQRGLAYTHLHSYQAAVNDFTNQISINKTQCALVNRCQAYNGTGAFSAAIADCVAAINILGSLPAVFNLAVAYDESGQTEKALENYRAYLPFAEEGSEAASYAQARIDALTVTPLALACSAPTSGVCIQAKVLPGELRLQGGFPHLTCEAG